MSEFRVWAPNAHSVAVDIESDIVPMHPEVRGWWAIDIPDAGPGTMYKFVLDDSDAFPDPRAPYQPQGVHERSAVVDHCAFKWTDANWQAPPLSSALIYELHVGTFTPQGTFESVIDRLDYLSDLGITHIELMPVNEFSGSWGWGYDGVDLYAPHHAYGDPESLKRLVDACHAKGLAVLLDVVYNHLGPAGNYLQRFGPYFTERHSTPWGPAVNLDGAGSDEVRRFLCDNALMWLRDYHFDGLRIDAVHALVDTSAVHLLEQMAQEVRELQAHLGRSFVLIAESDLNDPRVIRSPELGGWGLDSQWSDDFHHSLHTVLTGESAGYYEDFGSIEQLAYAIRHAFVYARRYSEFRARTHGRPPAGCAGWKFLGYMQNHDQVGNRALGERSSQLMNLRKLKIAAAVVLTAPFVPMLFQGEEWGASTPFLYFTHHDDPVLAHAVSEGRRREFAAFGWYPEDVPDPQAPETLERSKLKWEEISHEPQAGLFEWHKALIKLRRSIADLSNGRLDRLRTHFDERERWLVVERESVAIACNFSSEPRVVPVPRVARVLLASAHVELDDLSVRLPPESVAILGCE